MDVDTAPQGNGGCRRHWTEEEDRILVDCLAEICADWKAHTGFRNGYLEQLEKMMHNRIPGSKLRAKPHIDGRIKYLKKQAVAINEMVAGSGSGFAWDDVTCTVKCDKDVFDQWVKSHPSAKGLYGKKFPHLNVLCEIFAPDRANGMGAINPGEAEEHADMEGNDNLESTQNNPVSLNDIDFGDAFMTGEETQHTQTTSTPIGNNNAPRPPPLPRKHKSSAAIASSSASIASSFSRLVDVTVPYMTTLASVLAQENDISKQIATALSKLDGLNYASRIHAAEILNANPATAAVFLDAPLEHRMDVLNIIVDRVNSG